MIVPSLKGLDSLWPPGTPPLTRRATNLPPYGLAQLLTMSYRYDKGCDATR